MVRSSAQSAPYIQVRQHQPISMNAKERTKTRAAQILYRKVGRKYVRATDPYAMNGLANGWHLIKVEDGCTSMRETVYPANHELIAAARDMEDRLVDVIRKATEARPSTKLLKPDEKADWDWFIKKHGKSFNMLHYPSFADCARQIVATILGNKTPRHE